MLRGWARDVINSKSSIKHPTVNYRAPCRRRLRNMDEVHRYLRLTESHLGVDLFSFDSRVQGFKRSKPRITSQPFNIHLNQNKRLKPIIKNLSITFVITSISLAEWLRARPNFWSPNGVVGSIPTSDRKRLI